MKIIKKVIIERHENLVWCNGCKTEVDYVIQITENTNSLAYGLAYAQEVHQKFCKKCITKAYNLINSN